MAKKEVKFKVIDNSKKKLKFYHTENQIIKPLTKYTGEIIFTKKDKRKEQCIDELLDLINEYGSNKVFDKFLEKLNKDG